MLYLWVNVALRLNVCAQPRSPSLTLLGRGGHFLGSIFVPCTVAYFILLSA